ncbi:class I tRNA ligase family protein [Candidatus Vidania fulgoroideorum]
MKGNLKKLEKDIYNFWKKKNIYERIIKKKREKIFLHDGPPYANGKLHLGHIMNKILKDTVMKKMNLLNYKTFFLPGFDCHGIPIEINVKKKKYLLFRKYAKKQIKNQIKLFKKIGMIYNWKKYYKTMSFDTEYKTILAFKKIFLKKIIKIGKKYVNWCSKCNSSLSEFETINKKIKKKIFFYKNNKLLFFINKKNKLKKKLKSNLYFLIKYKKKFYFILKEQKKIFYNFLLKKIKGKYIKKTIRNNIEKICYFRKKIKLCSRHYSKTILKKKKQLFININFKKNLKKIIEKINFFPKYGKNELYKYIFNKPNWNISRNKKWGTVIPLIINKKKKKIFFFKKIKLIKKYGIDVWEKVKIKNKKFKKIKDTMDVWFDSGVTHYSIMKNKKSDFYIEGRDQYRGWFNSSLITSYMINKDSCYKNLIVHGFVLDENGNKLSKSLQNYVNPEFLIEKYGSEILRLYILSNNYLKNVNFSEKKIINIKNIYKKIRYIIKFIISNTIDLKKKKKTRHSEFDIYIINLFIEKIFLCFKYDRKFEYFNSFRIMKEFCFKNLNNYIEVIKDILYLKNKNSLDRVSCQKVLKYILKNILLFFSPYLSFTSEESWNKKKSIFLKRYKKFKIIKSKIKKSDWNCLFKIKKKFLFFLKKMYKKIDKPIFLKLKTNKNIKKIPKYYIKKILKISKIKLVKSKKIFQVIFLDYKKCIRCWNFFKKLKNNKCFICKNE